MMTTVGSIVHPRFNKLLIVRIDISIDGDTAVAFTENVEARFLAYDWQVLHVNDGDQYVQR